MQVLCPSCTVPGELVQGEASVVLCEAAAARGRQEPLHSATFGISSWSSSRNNGAATWQGCSQSSVLRGPTSQLTLSSFRF